MKTEFTDSEVEIMFRIIRHYLMYEEVMTHGHNDPRVTKLWQRLNLIRGENHAKRSKQKFSNGGNHK